MKIKEFNYTNLTNFYNKQLNEKLRLFNNDDDLISLWVFDLNINISLENLIESIYLNNLKKFRIIFSNNDFAKIEFEILKKSFNFKFDISKNKDHTSVFFDIYSKNNYQLNKTVFKQTEKSTSKKYLFIKRQIPEVIYYDNIKQYKHIEDIDLIDSEKLLIKSEIINLTIFHKNGNFIYSEIKTNFDINFIEDKFINYFNLVCFKKPLIEVFEHGIIRTDYFIRNKVIQIKNVGIILPDFELKLYSELRKLFFNQIKLIKINNSYDDRPSYEWKLMKKQNQEEIIMKNINNFINEKNINLNITISKLEYNYLLTVNLNSCKEVDTSKLIFDLEIYLKNTVDNRIELFYTEFKDNNPLRMKNSPI